MLRFGRSQRLTKATEFAAVYNARVRKSAGPLTVHALATGHVQTRLGLSVGRRVGGAVRRNRVKRMIREAFRLGQGSMPAPEQGGAYDLVVGVGPHEGLTLEEYGKLLVELAEACHRQWSKRSRRAPSDG